MGLRRDARRAWHDWTVNGLAAGAFGFPPLRVKLLRLVGLKIGSQSKIHGRCWFGGVDIEVGSRTWINYGTSFDNAARIVIGDDVLIGPQVMFITSGHEIGPSDRRGAKSKADPIAVGSGCWIGARTTVLPGVTIGEGCVIAAGSLVNRDCPPNTVLAGVPARVIREL